MDAALSCPADLVPRKLSSAKWTLRVRSLLQALWIVSSSPSTSEEDRQRFVKHATGLALETPDVDFLSTPWLRTLFTEVEIADLLALIRSELIPNLDAHIDAFRDNFPGSDEDPDGWFAPLSEVIETLLREFEEEPDVVSTLREAEADVNLAIEDVREEHFYSGPEDYEDYSAPLSGRRVEGRSVFDDVDE